MIVHVHHLGSRELGNPVLGAVESRAWRNGSVIFLDQALGFRDVKIAGDNEREIVGRVVGFKEFADVIAWLASLANITGIDLETAAITKYNYKCPKCGSSPCQCTF
jgi:hypothetical protein